MVNVDLFNAHKNRTKCLITMHQTNGNEYLSIGG